MDRRERLQNPQAALQMALDGLQAGIWTTLPVIIESFDNLKMSCVAQCAIQYARFPIAGGEPEWLDIPPLLDCPVIFPNGGGFTLTFPLTNGDEAIAFFSSRCIDAWWQSGGYKNKQPLLRMHDLSDGFILAGARSQPRVLSGGVSTTSAQLRSDDGTTYLDLKSGVITVNAASTIVNSTISTINATGGTTINANTQINGTLKVSGDITDNSGTNSATMATMRTAYNGHTHVDPQGGNTSGPSTSM